MALINWALRRQILFIFILIALVALGGYVTIVRPIVNKAPSCVDGIKNGDEAGIDCGGSCAIACTTQVDPVTVLWARAFKVVPGRYNAVAYLENHNKNVAVDKINYRFRFADANNVYIGKREGTTFVPTSGKFAVFEPGIDIGNSIPIYTTFEFTSVPVWTKVPQDRINQFQVPVSNITLTGADTNPVLSATVKNNSFFTIPNVGVVVILYDKDGNAVSTSRTYISQLGPEESSNINFTWPEPFSAPIVVKEIIPLFNIFSVNLQ